MAVPNVMQIAPFQMMDRWGGDMLDPGFPTSPDRFLVIIFIYYIIIIRQLLRYLICD